MSVQLPFSKAAILFFYKSFIEVQNDNLLQYSNYNERNDTLKPENKEKGKIEKGQYIMINTNVYIGLL